MLGGLGKVRPAVLIVAVFGLLVGSGTYLAVRKYESDQAYGQFEEHVSRQADAIEHEVRTCVESLYAIRALFLASEEVIREEFATFVADAGTRHPAIRALEWAPFVPDDERETHERSVREEGYSDYRIKDRWPDHMMTAPRREAYVPVLFVEPYAGNEDALGFDLADEGVRGATLDAAVDTGEAVLSDPVELVQEPAVSKSVLGVLAVCERGAATSELRRDTLQGYVVLVLRIDDILIQALGEDFGSASPAMHFRLLDPEAGDRELVLHTSTGSSKRALSTSWDAHRDIMLGGQTWRMLAAPTSAFVSERRSSQPILLGLITLLLSVIVAGAVVHVQSASRKAVLHKHEKRARDVLRSLGEGVVVANADGEIEHVNDAARGMIKGFDPSVSTTDWSTAYGLYRADRTTPVPPDELPLVRAARGEQVSGEWIFARDDQDPQGRWLRVSSTPLLDESKVVHGSVMVISDVTKERRAEEAGQHLSNAVEQTADAVFITTRSGAIMYVNPAFEEVTGFSKAETLGKTPRLLKSGLHDDRYYESLWSTIRNGDVFRSTTVNRKKSGDLYFAEQTITPMKDSQGRVTHFVSVMKDMTEKRRLLEQDAEMRLAAVVQQKLYPQQAPEIDGLDVAGIVRPADMTCGDYFDYIHLPDGMLGVAIGDVSGHGFGPALLMAQTRAFLRALSLAQTAPDALLRILNRTLAPDLEAGLFVTLLIARIDPLSRQVVHASAGHPPAYVIDRSGKVKAELSPTGTALGVLEDSDYGTGEPVTLEDGDTLLLLTDGITEARSADGELFEHERAIEVVRAHPDASAQDLVTRLLDAVSDFTGDRPPEDDRTLVVCKVEPRST
ncbi:MAG: SpoIIE family protein phosphatase [Planctomycetota bacterium]|jgi:sigma-B regulation protein RsbU (phosphoserine phosphatase)